MARSRSPRPADVPPGPPTVLGVFNWFSSVAGCAWECSTSARTRSTCSSSTHAVKGAHPRPGALGEDRAATRRAPRRRQRDGPGRGRGRVGPVRWPGAQPIRGGRGLRGVGRLRDLGPARRAQLPTTVPVRTRPVPASASRCSPGEDEARYTFLAARRGAGWSAGRLLVLDIGGGSLELAAGTRRGPGRWRKSLPLGAGRLDPAAWLSAATYRPAWRSTPSTRSSTPSSNRSPGGFGPWAASTSRWARPRHSARRPARRGRSGHAGFRARRRLTDVGLRQLSASNQPQPPRLTWPNPRRRQRQPCPPARRGRADRHCRDARATGRRVLRSAPGRCVKA